MEARKLLDAAPFKADVIKALKQAFDEALGEHSSLNRPGRRREREARPGACDHCPRGPATDDLAALKAAALASFEKNGTPLRRMSIVD
jgi:hypothetical protein